MYFVRVSKYIRATQSVPPVYLCANTYIIVLGLGYNMYLVYIIATNILHYASDFAISAHISLEKKEIVIHKTHPPQGSIRLYI